MTLSLAKATGVNSQEFVNIRRGALLHDVEKRIFGVVDMWDALTSDRPYRKAREESKALEYICTQSARHFDPEIVEIFLRVKPWMCIS